jgi:hypothetical protein
MISQDGLKQDFIYFKDEFPKRHINPFTQITKDEFEYRVDSLIADIDKLNIHEILVRFAEIIAAVKDAHTRIDITDGHIYPLEFFVFDDGLYVINADNSLADMLLSKVTKINGVDVSNIIEQLKLLIPHENDSCALDWLPNYINCPIYMYGLGIITDYSQTVFSIEKDGEKRDIIVPIIKSKEQSINWLLQEINNTVIGKYNKLYDYQYIEECKALLFSYNSCRDKEAFDDFNDKMFRYIEDKNVAKIIIDLRCNGGGSSSIIDPFIEEIPRYLTKKPDTNVYILVGRKTFSAGMFAIYQIMDAVPNAVSVGEPTGGALDRFGEAQAFRMPNSIGVQYSTKFFEFSRMFKYKNSGVNTFLPDIEIAAKFEDYILNNDAVLNYVLIN